MIKHYCHLKDCNRKHYAKGLCHAHHERKRRGAVNWTRPIGERNPWAAHRGRCAVDGCTKPHYAKRFCQPHYNVTKWFRIAEGDERKCDVPGCPLRHMAKGLCRAHYFTLRGRAYREALLNAVKS